MDWIIKKAFDNTITTLLSLIAISVIIVGMAVWFYLPFTVLSIKKEIKRIRQVLDEFKKIRLD
ncbi:hypothetical protein [Hippea sp. KM1]|uniref:hypothetical protein n=1 Tax=Hippea sp. KM1 TaxID=944481 RepID=UPI00046C9E72|nr:hypothetical protein [Hippea sp. KM1]